MIFVQKEDFDIGHEIQKLRADRNDIGALVSFTGLVRDMAQGSDVTQMVLEHYPGMTEKALSDLEDQSRARWPITDCLIIHRYGTLKAGENIVLVVTASAHRQAAFDAAIFLMDTLKTSAPFWKKEIGTNSTNWVSAKTDDDKQAERWNQ